jgi:hypothetical protein
VDKKRKNKKEPNKRTGETKHFCEHVLSRITTKNRLHEFELNS